MKEEIFKENRIFISEWIKLNPNFKGLSYDNNVLKLNDDTYIDLKTFLVSDLLKNDYFKNNIYSMSLQEFIKIIKFHIAAEKILNNEQQNVNKIVEYVKNIKINEQGLAVILTKDSKIIINDLEARVVLSKYNSLLLKFNHDVPLNELLKSLNKEIKLKNNNSNLNFFDLLLREEELNTDEYTFITHISNIIFKLLNNEHLLVENARHLLDIYLIEMNKLKNSNRLTPAQKYALKLYDECLLSIEEKNKKNEESNSLNSSLNYGYSTLYIILTSVIISGIVLFYLIVCR